MQKKNEKSEQLNWYQFLPSPLYKVIRCTMKEGPKVCIHKIMSRLSTGKEYDKWMKYHEFDLLDTKPLSYQPKISVVVPVYNVEDGMLIDCIESVTNQTYENWELVLVDDCSTMKSVKEVLAKYDISMNAKADKRIKVCYRKENGHISKATNTGFENAIGEFVALLDCDDLLAPNALYEVAKCLNKNPQYDYIYSDEDKITQNGKKRHYPFFKPDWSPDTIMSLMYTCHLSVYRKSLIDDVGGMRIGLEGSQDYDLVLRIMEKTNRIGHIAKILYHWRERKESTATNVDAKPYILNATKQAKLDALERRGLSAHLEYLDFCAQYRVVYHVQNHPKVSVIIPSKDHPELFLQCVETMRQNTGYDNYEVILVDNGSTAINKQKYASICKKYDCRYHYEVMDFNFSKMCNMGAGFATGEYLLFLNDDIEILPDHDDWMERMLGHAQLSHVGAVGCKLLYPNSHMIQHSGVMNLANGPGHAFHRMDDEVRQSWDRNKLEYNFSAVTGACLLVSKAKFEQVGGFEEELVVGYNDVDLCIKLLEAGYFNVLRNDVTQIHHESVSRGDDRMDAKKAARLKKERDLLFERHPWYRHHDPCYNVNLVKNRGDYSVDVTDYTKFAKPVRIEEFPSQNIEMDNFENSVECQVENLSIEDGWLLLEGYAYSTTDKNTKKMTVILQNTTNEAVIYEIVETKQYRQDILEITEQKQNAFCGFAFRIEMKLLEPGIYEIDLVVGNHYKKLKDSIEVKG